MCATGNETAGVRNSGLKRLKAARTTCTLPVRIPFVQRTGSSYGFAMTKQQVLDLYFMEARAKLIDIAAFLDRLDRAEGAADFRFAGFQSALKQLNAGSAERAKQVLLSLSDPTADPIPAATTKAACGAWPGSAN